jgi:hypothetical protein
MTIALGLIFVMLLAVALWGASNESAELVESAGPLRQADPDQTDDDSAWGLLGWHTLST